jgi:hypothetical protein
VAMQPIRVCLSEGDRHEREVLHAAFEQQTVLDWHGFRVRVSAEVPLGPGSDALYVYELQLAD